MLDTEKSQIDIRISACLIVKNESEQLGKALSDLSEVCDEIVVVDTGSTDNTVSIAKVHGARVFSYNWVDHFGKARNYSFDQAKNDWIFYIDADERLSKSLKAHLKSLPNRSGSAVFRFPVIDELAPNAGGTDPGPIRLFDRRLFRYSEDPHGHTQTPIFDCPQVNTSYPIIHCQRNNSTLIDPTKILARVAIDIRDWPKTHNSLFYIFLCFWVPIKEFFKRYIGRCGYKDGIIGFKWILHRCLYYFLRYLFVALKPRMQDASKIYDDDRTRQLIEKN